MCRGRGKRSRCDISLADKPYLWCRECQKEAGFIAIGKVVIYR